MSNSTDALIRQIWFLKSNFKKNDELDDVCRIYISGFNDYLNLIEKKVIKEYEETIKITITSFLNDILEEVSKKFDVGVISKKYFYGAKDAINAIIHYVLQQILRGFIK